MGIVLLDITMSLDGFVAEPHGELGRIHDWIFRSYRGEAGSGQVLADLVATTGSVVMGRRTYDIGARHGAFVDYSYQVPIFVLTTSPPERVADGGLPFTFYSGGVDHAVAAARVAAGDRNVTVLGGADTARQCLTAGLIDQIQLHLVPVLLGEGIPLFGPAGLPRTELDQIDATQAPGVTHLRFRLAR